MTGELGEVELCSCGHPLDAHAAVIEDLADGELVLPVAAQPCWDRTARWPDLCPCSDWRPRRPAPLWLRAVNAVLGRAA